jgi:TetR/AcrR family tetracycline transcriptional repressor
MALDRDLIVRTALRLLDDAGLDTLSLRRLAKELDVHASAMYWHFTNKQELLDEMARAIVLQAIDDDIAGPESDTWEAWLAYLARAQHRAVRSHRDGVRLLLAARPTADYQVAYLTELMERLTKAGFTPAQAGDAFAAVGNYALGAAITRQQSEEVASIGEEFRHKISDNQTLSAIAEAVGSPDTTFERGLQWLITGMRHTIGDDTR